MIPREILKKIRQIEIRTNRLVTVSWSERLWRAIFGVALKTSFHKFSRPENLKCQSNELSGETPEPARGTRALPIPSASGARASSRFAVQEPGSSNSNSSPYRIQTLKRRERRAPTRHALPLGLRPLPRRLSLTPGFSPVTSDGGRFNRFSGFSRAKKPMKRLDVIRSFHTRQKPSANERRIDRKSVV